MPFYKFNWGSKNNKDNLINNTEKGAINTKKINQFIKPDIEDSKKSNNDVDEELLILSIKHFIDTSFKKDSDINKMGYERVGALGGDEGYNFPGIITRMETGNYMDIPNQRYIEEPSLGTEKSIPLSFYFDVSGSMYEYTDLLAKISFLLLKNGISIIYGFNNYVNGYILADEGIKTLEELKSALLKHNYGNHIKDDNIRDIDIFLKERNAEKCVLFSDFDPYRHVCKLSQFCKVYWFCFEKRYNYTKYDFKSFKGNVYYTQNFSDLRNHFLHMDSIDYVDTQKKLILSKTERRNRNGKY